MQPLLILFINLGLGGVQRKIVDMVNYLGDYRPNLPIFIILRSKEEFDLSPEIKNSKTKVICYADWTKKRIKIPLFFPVFVIYKVWRLRPKAILAFLDFASLPALWAKLVLFWRKTKVVLSEDHYASKVVPLFKFGRFRNFLMKTFYPFADMVFACSQAGREDLIKNYRLPPEKVKVIKNWTTFSERKVEKREKKYDFVYIGRFFKTKNLAFLIKAVKKIKTKKKDINLCLVGSGQEKENLVELVKKYHLEENISFFEPTREVEKFLTQAKIFVLASEAKAEGFPMTVLEAMALKTPVLSRDFAGAGEFLKDDQNCYLFNSEEEFIKKALWLLDNPGEREKVAKKAYAYVKKNHSPENMKDYFKALKI